MRRCHVSADQITRRYRNIPRQIDREIGDLIAVDVTLQCREAGRAVVEEIQRISAAVEGGSAKEAERSHRRNIDEIASGKVGDEVVLTARGRAVAGGKHESVGAAVAGQCIATGAAGQPIGNRVADNGVVAGAADRILDVRMWIATEQIGIADIALRVIAVAEIGKLGLRRDRPGARIEVDRNGCRVVREVVGIDAVAVPDRLKYAVRGAAGAAARRELADAVDEHLAGRRAPAIDGVAALGVVVGAIERLQGENVVRHVGLREAVGFGRVPRERRAGIAAVAHDGVLGIVVRVWHRDIGDAAGFLAVLEAERVTELVQRGGELVVAELGARIVVPCSEPDIAASRVIARIVSVGGGVCCRRLRDLEVGGVGAGIADRDVGVALDQPDGVIDRRLHRGGGRSKSRHYGFVGGRVAARGIIARRIREAVGDRAAPLGAAKQTVDFRISRCADANSRRQVNLLDFQPSSDSWRDLNSRRACHTHGLICAVSVSAW